MKKGAWLTGLGLLGACGLCCALPIIIGGAATLGISSFYLNPTWIIVIALVVIVTGLYAFNRHRSRISSCSNASCSCKTTNKCVTKEEV